MALSLYSFEIKAWGIAGRADKRRVRAPGVLDAVLLARQERGWTEQQCRAEIVDPYEDDEFPERACDRCGNKYRGPAVYCSQVCAEEDA